MSIMVRIIDAINTSGSVSKLKDLEKEWNDYYHHIVQFHLKKQPKYLAEPGFDLNIKAGQGISAWSKMLNVIFSSYIRSFDHALYKIISENVQIAYGQSDRNLSLFFNKFKPQLETNVYKKLSADFSEFDSSQEMQGVLAGNLVLKMCGVPENFKDVFGTKKELDITKRR